MQSRSAAYRKTKQIIGRIAIAVVMLHIALILFFGLGSPKALEETHLNVLYSEIILLGPFFSDDRILTSPHILARYKAGEMWSPFLDNGSATPGRPENYHGRIIKDFMQNRARAAYGTGGEVRQRARPLRQLEQFLTTHVFKHKTIDSLHLIYLQYRYIPASDQQVTDTLFQLKYALQTAQKVE